jgi:hypothetical protein
LDLINTLISYNTKYLISHQENYLLFNSYEFIFAFLPITFFIYFYLNHKRLTEASKGFLVFSSLFFYSWWNIAYLPIILSSMLFNFVIAFEESTSNGCCGGGCESH